MSIRHESWIRVLPDNTIRLRSARQSLRRNRSGCDVTIDKRPQAKIQNSILIDAIMFAHVSSNRTFLANKEAHYK